MSSYVKLVEARGLYGRFDIVQTFKQGLSQSRCISSWIRSALDNTAEYPKEVLSFFDLSIP